MAKIKNINKTKTIIAANLYDSHGKPKLYGHGRFVTAALQLAAEFPETFVIVESSMWQVIIKTTDLKHCFNLYKHNEDKVIKTA